MIGKIDVRLDNKTRKVTIIADAVFEQYHELQRFEFEFQQIMRRYRDLFGVETILVLDPEPCKKGKK